MELKRRFGTREVLIAIYAVFLIAYMAVFLVGGLKPAGASQNYERVAGLAIPSIGLDTDVTALSLVDGELETPDTVVGSFTRAEHKVFLVGHVETVFKDLKSVKIGDEISYDGKRYRIVKEQLAVKEVVGMNEILAPAEQDTLVIMTCDGKMLGGGDATHRFIVTAVIE